MFCARPRSRYGGRGKRDRHLSMWWRTTDLPTALTIGGSMLGGSMPRHTFLVIVFLLCGLAAHPSTASGQPYTLVYVPAPEASCELQPRDINNSQQIVGTVSTFDL